MLPTLELGLWHASTYQIAGALALVVAGLWSFHRLLCLDYGPGVVLWGVLLVIAAGFAGTFLANYLINVRRVARSGLLVRPEGLSIVWALASGVAAAAVYFRLRRVSLGRVLDAAAPPWFLGLAIGRLGCFAAGCCYGRPTDSWLGMTLPDDRGVWTTRYPTQLMSAAANLLVCFALLAVERTTARQGSKAHSWSLDGFLALLGIGLYSLKRFGMAFLRQSGAFPMVGPFSWMHVSALVGLVGAGALISWNLVRKGKERTLP